MPISNRTAYLIRERHQHIRPDANETQQNTF